MGENGGRSRSLFDGHLTVQMQSALGRLIARPNMTPRGCFIHDADAPDASHASPRQINHNPEALATVGCQAALARWDLHADHEIAGVAPKIHAAAQAPAGGRREANPWNF